MNIKEFFKRDNLDEMQKQTLLKIESCGFWALWVLLLAALIIESLLGFTPREMAAEWFIFMLGSAYSVLSDLRAGIWDRHLKANTKTNAAVSFLHLRFLFCLFKAFCRQERQEHNGVLHCGRGHIAPGDDLIGNIRRTGPD